MSSIDLFEEAFAQQRAESGKDAALAERHVLFVGTKSGGKSTLIQRFLDVGESPKPTVALEYRFARRSRATGSLKDVGHVWELGGGTLLSSLVDKVLNADRLTLCTIFLCVDLSQPTLIWPTLERFIYTIQVRTKALFSENRTLGTPDNTLGVPWLLIGCKYDLFQSLESEQRKTICKLLRAVALQYGAAALAFVSCKQESLVSRLKSMMGAALFGGDLTAGEVNTDHNKPLFVPRGKDSDQAIGVPSVKSLVDSSGGLAEQWRGSVVEMFGNSKTDSTASATEDDPVKAKQFEENAVDEMRRRKDDELDKYRRVSQRRLIELQQQLAAEGNLI